MRTNSGTGLKEHWINRDLVSHANASISLFLCHTFDLGYKRSTLRNCHLCASQIPPTFVGRHIGRENLSIVTTLKSLVLTVTRHLHHIKLCLWGLGFSCIFFFSAQKIFSALSKRPFYFIIFGIYHSWLRFFFPLWEIQQSC